MGRGRWSDKALALLAVLLWAGFAAAALAADAGAGGAVPEGQIVFFDTPMPPYAYGTLGQTAEDGISLHLVQELSRRLKVPMQVVLAPWPRVLRNAEFGQADGIPVLMHDPDRDRYLVFTKPLIVSREMFYYMPTRLGDFAWQDFADLKPYRIGLVRGYIYGPGFMAALHEGHIKAVYVDVSQDLFRMLVAGRVDLVLEDEYATAAIMEAFPGLKTRVRAADKPSASYSMHMGLSRLSPAAKLVGRIDEALCAMKHDGTLQALFGPNAQIAWTSDCQAGVVQ